MCGIVGCVGSKQALPILLKALERLEYRGYDSCGIAVLDGDIKVYKDAIRVQALQQNLPHFDGKLGIGHTRWATHGQPSQLNAHPHLDCSGKIAVVHNGVIKNFQQLRQQLIDEGHHFISETDTEVIPHLIEKYYRGDLETAVRTALKDVSGSYAILVMRKGDSNLVVAKKECPVIIGVNNNVNIIASDVTAILDHTNRVIYLEDGDIASISENSIEVKSEKTRVDRQEHMVLWDLQDVQKAGYEHFMLKEIHEQPLVIRNSLKRSAFPEKVSMDLGTILDLNMTSLLLLACGTSYYAAMIGKYLIEALLGIPVRVELASEFNYCNSIALSKTALFITQSGETADILLAMKRARSEGMQTIAITNVPGSTASRLANYTAFTQAGPEISVAATKSFTAQLLMLYQIVLSHPSVNHKISDCLFNELKQLPIKVEQVLHNDSQIVDCSRYLSRYEDTFFIARGINSPIALEGALKLKEISYIHAAGYPAGELKHGSIALLGNDIPVVAIVARDNTYETMLTNIKEVKARKSPVIAVAEQDDEIIEALADSVIRIPKIGTMFSPFVNVVVMQLLAYYTALTKGCPIDHPRNLAKSVTVE